MLALRSTRLSQAGATQVDWGNPITRGLVEAISNGAMSVRPTAGTYTLATSSAPIAQGLGVQLTANTSLASYVSPHLDFATGSSFTELLIYQLTTIPVAASRLAGNFLNAVGGRVFAPNTTNFRYLVSTPTNNIVVGSAISTNPKIDVGRFDGTTASYFENGVFSGSVAASFTGSGGTRNFGFGSIDGSNSVAGVIPLYIGWNRALSDKEVLSISANPWQVFK